MNGSSMWFFHVGNEFVHHILFSDELMIIACLIEDLLAW